MTYDSHYLIMLYEYNLRMSFKNSRKYQYCKLFMALQIF